MKKLYITLSIILFVCILFSVLFYFYRDIDYTVENLRTKSGYNIDIRTTYFLDVTRPIYCIVYKDNKTIFPKHLIGSTIEDIDELKFGIIENDMVAAVVEEANPRIILSLYDLESRKSWPTTNKIEAKESAYKKAKKQINLLNRKGTYTYTYTLSHEIPGDVDLKVR